MRISDWSSDVCSSDLGLAVLQALDRLRDQFGMLEHVIVHDRLDPGAVVAGQPRLHREQDAGADQRGKHEQPRQREAALRQARDHWRRRWSSSAFWAVKAMSCAIGRAWCRERVCPYV